MRNNSKKPRAHVLVVDDLDINQELMKEILEKLNCDVEIASSGIAALEMLTTHHYDIIFMDLQMPEMDGFEAAKAIRKQGKGKPLTPIVALTASDLDDSHEKCLEVGMDGCVTKPIEIKDIEDVLKKYLSEIGT